MRKNREKKMLKIIENVVKILMKMSKSVRKIDHRSRKNDHKTGEIGPDDISISKNLFGKGNVI